jgi:hypothetical protein
VVAKVVWHPGGLCPRVGFAFYNQRGTAEQWIREDKNAVTWTRLSCHRFAANGVRLQLHVLAYNLANFLPTLALPEAIKQRGRTAATENFLVDKLGASTIVCSDVANQGAIWGIPVKAFGPAIGEVEGGRTEERKS